MFFPQNYSTAEQYPSGRLNSTQVVGGCEGRLNSTQVVYSRDKILVKEEGLNPNVP